MNNLYTNGIVSTEVLGISFAPVISSEPVANGGLTFGGIGSSKYTGSITYAPRSNNSSLAIYWAIHAADITFGTTSLGNGTSFLDTGTSLVYLLPPPSPRS